MSTHRFGGDNSATGAEIDAVLAGRLRELQNQLLDLSRRNRLLNFHSDRGAGSLRVVDERSPEVFRTLVVEGRAMQFLSREEAPEPIAAALPPEADGEGSIGVALAPLDGAGLADRHRDKYLQTALPGEKLQTRLTRLAQQARSSLEEQGSNILYLALGVVAWRETPASDVVSTAPLLRVPGAPVIVRHRGGDCPVTRPELIPPEEYEEAVRLVLRREFGLLPDALCSQVVRAMGFERTGERLKDEVSRAVRRLLESGDARVDGRGYVVPSA